MNPYLHSSYAMYYVCLKWTMQVSRLETMPFYNYEVIDSHLPVPFPQVERAWFPV